MASGSSKSDNADKIRGADNKPEKRGTGAKPPKQQPDGSAVTTPPSDPANSDETLRRNRNGNS
jgi:hypothetical protein